MVCTTMKNLSSKLIRSYRSQVEDLTWARQGVIATVINGESVPLVQQRIEDGGFNNIVITPLGADKVVLHTGIAEN
ncbi:sulfate transporter, partial [Trifolium medium]|nr:sulfate transporter [Trifolium medium]